MLSNAFAHGEIFHSSDDFGPFIIIATCSPNSIFLGKGMDWKLTFAEKKQAEN